MDAQPLCLADAGASLRAVVAGPTTDYLFNSSLTIQGGTASGTLTAVNAAMGQFRFVSTSTVDQIATAANADAVRSIPGVTITPSGTWAVGLQGTLRVNQAATTTACTGTSTTTCSAATLPEGYSWACVSSFCTPGYTYGLENPVAYLAITDATAVPRRANVDTDQCNSCHIRLAGFHGNGRNDTEFCVMCHNSTFDNMTAPAAGTTRTTIPLSLANFVHRLHTGDTGLLAPIAFPADPRECTLCHVNEIDLDAMSTLRPVRTRVIDSSRATLSTTWTGATTSACTGCHDSASARAHGESMTTALGAESCATCHANGNEYGIDVVHARPEYDIR
jgi:OmcA/MtrC family decaheme c-type cytochrome